MDADCIFFQRKGAKGAKGLMDFLALFSTWRFNLFFSTRRRQGRKGF
jgi:hypothetical protein